MIRNWKSSSFPSHFSSSVDNSNNNSNDDNDDSGVLVGKILRHTSIGAWSFEIEIDLLPSENNNDNGNGNGRRAAVIQINAERFPDYLKPWMSIRKARKLLCPGVSLLVHYCNEEEEDQDNTGNNKSKEDEEDPTITMMKRVIYCAKKIRIVGIVPATPYLARLLSFSRDDLKILFSDDGSSSSSSSNSNDGLLNVACALRPCSLSRLEELWQLCQKQHIRNNGGAGGNSSKPNNLFKNRLLLDLCDEIRIHQGWSRGPQKAPSTSSAVWMALLRMEQRYLTSDEVDGTVEEETSAAALSSSGQQQPVLEDDDHHQHILDRSLSSSSSSSSLPSRQHLIYAGVNVDPSLNVPDPADRKRMSYIDQRKRPQVVWMVRKIAQLVGCCNENDDDDDHNNNNGDANDDPPSPPPKKKCQRSRRRRRLHLIDIGGGRGDLALAVAANLIQQFSDDNNNNNNAAGVRSHVHVTVLDVNQSSLKAAEDRAKAASLSGNMSFICQDITDRGQTLQKLDFSKYGNCDLVFGLHCCGGLAEAAVDLALYLRSNFYVSTCCFRSHQHLAVLSRIADNAGSSSNSSGSSGSHGASDHAKDRDLVASLAVLLKGQGQHRGIRVLNAMRLQAARQKWEFIDNNEETEKKRVLRTWQETFPIEYSVQNRIMVGCMSK